MLSKEVNTVKYEITILLNLPMLVDCLHFSPTIYTAVPLRASSRDLFNFLAKATHTVYSTGYSNTSLTFISFQKLRRN